MREGDPDDPDTWKVKIESVIRDPVTGEKKMGTKLISIWDLKLNSLMTYIKYGVMYHYMGRGKEKIHCP